MTKPTSNVVPRVGRAASAIALCLAAMLLYFAAGKLWVWGTASDTARAQPPLTTPYIVAVIAEVLLAATVGLPRTRVRAALLVAGGFAGAGIITVARVARGEGHVQCGCAGEGTTLHTALLLQGLVVLLAGALLRLHASRLQRVLG